MSDFTIRDRNGNLIGRISESPAPGCVGCLGLSLIAALVWGGISLYHVVQRRLADGRIEAQRITIPPNTLDAYTGEYKYPRYRIRIEHRGNRLFNISPEEFCELVPISTQEFIYARCANGFQGRARFERDARGNVVLVVVHRDGRAERAAKLN